MPQSVPPVAIDAPEAVRSPTAPTQWLLIGPMTRECALWGAAPQTLLMHLRAVQPRAELFQLDLPGTGRLWRERSPSRVAALCEHLRQRVQAAGVSGPVGLLAYSWASCVATEWARLYPEEVGALVLVSPGMRPFTRVLRGPGPGLWVAGLSQLLGRRSPFERERRLWNTHTELHDANEERLAAWRRLRAEHPLKARNGLAQLLAVWRYQGSRRRPHPQVLLLAGKGDRWLDWHVSAAISRAWGAALRVHPEAGHDLLLDDATWVGRSLAEWLLPVGSGALISNL